MIQSTERRNIMAKKKAKKRKATKKKARKKRK